MKAELFRDSDIDKFIGEMSIESIANDQIIDSYHHEYLERWVDFTFGEMEIISRTELLAWMKVWITSNPGGYGYRVCGFEIYNSHHLRLVSEYVHSSTEVWDDLFVYKINDNEFRVKYIRNWSFDGRPISIKAELQAAKDYQVKKEALAKEKERLAFGLLEENIVSLGNELGNIKLRQGKMIKYSIFISIVLGILIGVFKGIGFSIDGLLCVIIIFVIIGVFLLIRFAVERALVKADIKKKKIELSEKTRLQKGLSSIFVRRKWERVDIKLLGKLLLSHKITKKAIKVGENYMRFLKIE